jgi:hypothetical protein
MSNPLAIPDIIAKVIENLDTKDLVKVSYLNKTWRLEARRNSTRIGVLSYITSLKDI